MNSFVCLASEQWTVCVLRWWNMNNLCDKLVNNEQFVCLAIEQWLVCVVLTYENEQFVC
jgi:hypothetical protein